MFMHSCSLSANVGFPTNTPVLNCLKRKNAHLRPLGYILDLVKPIDCNLGTQR